MLTASLSLAARVLCTTRLSVVSLFVERQLATDRAISAMRTNLDSLDSAGETVERTPRAAVLGSQGLNLFFCLFIFLLCFNQQRRDVLVHRLVGVVHLLGGLGLPSLAVRNPRNGGTDTARRDCPLQNL